MVTVCCEVVVLSSQAATASSCLLQFSHCDEGILDFSCLVSNSFNAVKSPLPVSVAYWLHSDIGMICENFPTINRGGEEKFERVASTWKEKCSCVFIKDPCLYTLVFLFHVCTVVITLALAVLDEGVLQDMGLSQRCG